MLLMLLMLLMQTFGFRKSSSHLSQVVHFVKTFDENFWGKLSIRKSIWAKFSVANFKISISFH